MLIRDATAGDWSQIWPFLREIVRAGETYAFDTGRVFPYKASATLAEESGGTRRPHPAAAALTPYARLQLVRLGRQAGVASTKTPSRQAAHKPAVKRQYFVTNTSGDFPDVPLGAPPYGRRCRPLNRGRCTWLAPG